LEAANPEAVAALWMSHNSVSRCVMRLYNYLQPRVAVERVQRCGKPGLYIMHYKLGSFHLLRISRVLANKQAELRSSLECIALRRLE
jgi:hypothetical protein